MTGLQANGVSFEMVRVASGQFSMGSPNSLFSEGPSHLVVIRADFLLGLHPVTQRQWQAVMQDNPSGFPDSPSHPVESVNWDRAVEFCARLTEIWGKSVRLPSEAEWEYACRAGTETDFFFGAWGPFADSTEIPAETQRMLSEFAWFDLNSRGRTHPVSMLRPNPWGLHDMIGNVWEWCADVWHDDYLGAPDDAAPWSKATARQPYQCLRGGAWDMDAFRCRSSYRSFDHRELATRKIGLRIVVEVE